MTPLRAWALVGVVAAVLFALPKAATNAGFGPWHFAVTAAGHREFRKVYAFRSRRACEDERRTMERGIARVQAEQGGTTVGGIARRVRIAPCAAVRRPR